MVTDNSSTEYLAGGNENEAISLSDSETSENGTSYSLVLPNQYQEETPSFGNISVVNSADVHFGNKTLYQGPVTIKQFLYANSKSDNNCDKLGEGSFANISELCVDALPEGLNKNTILKDLITKNDTCMHDAENLQDPRIDSKKSIGLISTKRLRQKPLCIAVIVLALLVISIMIFLLTMYTKSLPKLADNGNQQVVDTDEQETNFPVEPSIDPDSGIPAITKLKLIPRAMWVAQPPTKPVTKLHTPVPFVIISHTATENCTSLPQCVEHVRYIQMFHVESKQWYDIAYNFLLGGDGSAYEGRGWTGEGAHTYSYNSRSIGIAFIGTFQNYKPSRNQLLACKFLIQKGVELGYIDKDYKLFGARQLQTTQSPGDYVYEEIKKWSHWAKSP